MNKCVEELRNNETKYKLVYIAVKHAAKWGVCSVKISKKSLSGKLLREN